MDILTEASKITDEILKLAEAIVLTGSKEQEEAEVEAYATMIEAREPLIAKLLELKKGIDSDMESSPDFVAIQQTIGKISEIDKLHQAVLDNMYEGMQTTHKDIKVGQRVQSAYAEFSPDAASRFDITQ